MTHATRIPALSFRLIEAKLIWIQDRVLEKAWKTNAVTVEDIPAWFVRSGRLLLEMDDGRIGAGADHWMFPRQGQGRVHTLPGSKILSFRFRLRWPDGQEVHRRRRTLVFHTAKQPVLAKASKALLAHLGGTAWWHEDQWTPPSCATYLSIQARFHDWLSAYGRMMDANGLPESLPDRAAIPALEARRVLMEWSLAKPFSRNLLSRKLGIGIQTVSKYFAAHYSTTPREFFEQRKIQWAQQRLAMGGERIKVIAAELGFSSMAQFSNWFRLRNQMSPREWRRFATQDTGLPDADR
jgi:AraC-like DNA-binding protein